MADQDPDQTDNLTLNEDKLDYEADEGIIYIFKDLYIYVHIPS